MSTYRYDDFEITLTGRPDGSHSLTAVCPDGTTFTRTFNMPLARDELETTILAMARARSRKASSVPGWAPPSIAADVAPTREVAASTTTPTSQRDEHAEVLGAKLANALFEGEVGSAYDAARRASVAERRGLRLTLTLGGAPDLLNLPWEFLYRRPRFLASQRHTPLVRRLRAVADDAPPEITEKVRILGVVASPRNLTELDTAQERTRVEEAIRPMIERGRVELDWLEPATPRRLREVLRDDRYHVLHYVGHSAFTDQNEGALYLEDDAGGAAVVDNTMLANLLSDQTGLRLVVLNSCEGARTTVRDPYAGIATTLIQLGVPAVVAMQFEISDRAAILFAEELYTNLIGRQDPIDAAVAEARKAIYVEVDRVEWATPVLFVRDPDVELFRFRVERERLPPLPPPGIDPEMEPVLGEPAESTESTESSGPEVGDDLRPDTEPRVDVEATGVTPIPSTRHDQPVGLLARVGRLFTGTLRFAAIGVAVLTAVLIAIGLATLPWGELGNVPIASETSSEITSQSPAETRTDAAAEAIVPDPLVDSVAPHATSPAAGATAPGADVATPRPEFGNLAIELGRETGEVHIKSFDVETGVEGNLTDRPGAVDSEADWQPGTSRIAFVRSRPADGEGTRINYAADSDLPNGIRGKSVAPLIPWQSGTFDHAPAWSADGDLLYARSVGCAPGARCGDVVRRARFAEGVDDRGFVDELTLLADDEIAAGFSDVTAIAAHPLDDGRAVIADASGVWFLDARGPTLVLGGVSPTSMDFTGDGELLVMIVTNERSTEWGLIETATGELIVPEVSDDRLLGARLISVTADGDRGMVALSSTELPGVGSQLARVRVAGVTIEFVEAIPDDAVPAGIPRAVDR